MRLSGMAASELELELAMRGLAASALVVSSGERTGGE
jgi:hypothetical protein